MPRLDRLDEAASSPGKRRQFDVLLSVTAPHEFLMFIITLVLIALAIAWMLFWKVERTISIDGLLINPGARHEVIAIEPGYLVEYLHREGDIVKPGDIIARQSVPTLDRELALLREQLLQDDQHINQADLKSLAEQEGHAAIRLALYQLEAQRAVRENIVTHIGGEVMVLHVDPGEFLPAGAFVSRIRSIPEDQSKEMQVVLRVDTGIAQRIQLGMPSNVQVNLPGRDTMQFTGEVVAVTHGPLPNWLATLPPITGDARSRIDIELHQQPENPLPNATLSQVDIFLGESTPLQLLAPKLAKN